jgi:hypothetical protein
MLAAYRAMPATDKNVIAGSTVSIPVQTAESHQRNPYPTLMISPTATDPERGTVFVLSLKDGANARGIRATPFMEVISA